VSIPRAVRPLLWIGIAAALGLLMVVPTGNGEPFSLPTAPLGAPLAVELSVPRVGAAAPPRVGNLPGAAGTGAYSDSVRVAQDWNARFAGASLRDASRADAGRSGEGTAPLAPPPPKAPATGTVTGYVDSTLTPGTGLSGVSVEAYSRSGVCPTTLCLASTTDSTGHFSVTALAGPFDYLEVTASYFLTNYSYLTASVPSGGTVNSGTTFLVPTAKVSGFVLADTSPRPTPLAGVVVSATTLNGTSVSPLGITNAQGQFVAAMPPAPSRIQFTPPDLSGATGVTAYEGNFTWANATPGEDLSVGIVRLEPFQSYYAHVFDAVTRQLISGPGENATIQVCDQVTGLCGGQGNASEVGVPTALGPTGNLYVSVEVVGYLTTTRSVGYFGRHLPGLPAFLGNLYLMPPATAVINASLEYDRSNASVRANLTSILRMYPTGDWWAQVCSLDGFELAVTHATVVYRHLIAYNNSAISCVEGGCVPLGQPIALPAFPLYDVVTIYPDAPGTGGPCGLFPTWPLPGDLPVEPTRAWANFTPDAVTTVTGEFPVGTYLYGQVFTKNTLSPPKSGFLVTVTPTTYPDPGVIDSYFSATSPWKCPNVTFQPGDFCVPAPPGPVTLQVSGSGALSSESNSTWATTPRVCCDLKAFPESLGVANDEGKGAINLTPPAGVSGRVTARSITGTALDYASVEVCALSGANCFINVTDANGSFNRTPAGVGWNYVTASAAGYTSNTAWVNVQPETNTSVGSLPLAPLATLTGRVVTPSGAPVLDAHASYCPLTAQTLCSAPLGTGEVSTGGVYVGFVPGGTPPGSTYKVEVSAAGYSDNWAWANASPGATTVVPTIVLVPTGAGSGSSGARGGWVLGRLVDATLGTPVVVPAGGFQLTSTAGLPGGPFASGTNTGGEFNETIGSGFWFLNISTQGYFPVSVYVNASGGGRIGLGTIALTPWPWVEGNVSLAPWSPLSVPDGPNASGRVNVSLAPPAEVTACLASGSFACSSAPLSEMTDTFGYFRVQVPGYGPVNVTAIGLFAGAPGGNSAQHGFSQPSVVFNLSASGAWVPRPLPMSIFAVYVGHLADATAGAAVPVRYGSVSFSFSTSTDPDLATVSGVTDAQGNYTLFALPFPGPTRLGPNATLFATGPTFEAAQFSYNGTVAAGSDVPLPPLALTEYGWVEFRVLTRYAYSIPDPTVSLTAVDPATGFTDASSGTGNFVGWVNASAPPGSAVNLTVSTLSDFSSVSLSVAVAPGRTTFANGGSRGHLAALPALLPWGLVASAQVNYSNRSLLPTLVDAVHQTPLANVQLSVEADLGAFASYNPQPSNQEGQFLLDAPIGSADTLLASAAGYRPNATTVRAPTGAFVTEGTINLTGDGILAGRVIGYPSLAPVPGAIVTACPIALPAFCGVAITNGTGAFWVNATPDEPIRVSVSAFGFLSNATVAEVCSDCWSALPLPVELPQFASIAGYVRGLPVGLPLLGASVAVCPSKGSAQCIGPVPTDPAGYFSTSFPAGTYWLSVGAPGYASTGETISLGYGENALLGTIFLYAVGTVTGRVVDATSGAGVPGAVLELCADASSGGCSGNGTTNATGAFSVAGDPGPSTLVVSAQGYANAFVATDPASGASVALGAPVRLLPLGVDEPFPVAGTVNAEATALVNSSGPLADALVLLYQGTVPVGSTRTDPNGSFLLIATPGNYTLSVEAPGYATARIPTVVGGATSLGAIALLPQLFAIGGTAVDALLGTPLAGVTLSVAIGAGTERLGTTNASGDYAIALPNGTWPITAAATADYAPVAFGLTVAGAPQRYALALGPPVCRIQGNVADGISRAPVAGARLTLSGTAIDGAPVERSIVSAEDGSFLASVPYGNYTTTIVAPGYSTQVASLTLGVPARALQLTLVAISATAAPAPLPVSLPVLVVAAAALLSVGALAVMGPRWRARRGVAARGVDDKENSPPRGVP
jgi:hypothetical protein